MNMIELFMLCVVPIVVALLVSSIVAWNAIGDLQRQIDDLISLRPTR